ncbi:MAG: glycosyltransferase, partial [Acidobacteriota bacterium]|nr:glycosyltransferase [Acidobacteriota bacterium]
MKTGGPLRVVHVGKFYPPATGGMERVLESLCEEPTGGVESRVIVFNNRPATVHEIVRGVPVTRVGIVGRAGSVPLAPALPAEIRRARGDLLIVHEPNPWALLSLAIARPTLPVAIWFHSEVVRPRLQYALFYHPLARRAYQRARRIVVSSPALGEDASALQPYRDKVRV